MFLGRNERSVWLKPKERSHYSLLVGLAMVLPMDLHSTRICPMDLIKVPISTHHRRWIVDRSQLQYDIV